MRNFLLFVIFMSFTSVGVAQFGNRQTLSESGTPFVESSDRMSSRAFSFPTDKPLNPGLGQYTPIAESILGLIGMGGAYAVTLLKKRKKEGEDEN